MRSFDEKFVPIKSLAELSKKLHQNKSKIVSTNGCFDILHLGHIQYLKEAKALGDKLIVGINADISVKKIKPKGRPVNSENVRVQILAALEAVDYVTVFSEDTPEKFLSLLNTGLSSLQFMPFRVPCGQFTVFVYS